MKVKVTPRKGHYQVKWKIKFLDCTNVFFVVYMLRVWYASDWKAFLFERKCRKETTVIDIPIFRNEKPFAA